MPLHTNGRDQVKQRELVDTRHIFALIGSHVRLDVRGIKMLCRNASKAS
jgi:hypothetical protein